MKKVTLVLLLFTSFGFSQELMNYYIEPNTNSNTVDLHTTVYKTTITSYEGYNISNSDNTITISLCYLNTSVQLETIDFQNFEINLPSGYSNYTLKIEIYGDNNGIPCSLDNLVDSNTIDFNYPYNPTEKTTIPDDAFEGYFEDLGYGDDLNNNDLVLTHRIVNISHLFLSNLFTIESLEGIDTLGKLKDLRFSNNLVTDVDLSSNTSLERLFCDQNPLIQLDVSSNNKLKDLLCSFTEITTLDISNNIDLESLNIGYNNISTLDLSQNINLYHLEFSGCQFSNIDLSNNTLLTFLDCSYNLLTTLNLSNNNLLESLFCQNNQITTLNIDDLTNFKYLFLYNNQLTTLDLSSNSQLEMVLVFSNNFTSLNIKNGNNLNLTSLDAGNNDYLFCIDVDDEDAANNGEFPYSNWGIEDWTSFSEDCSLSVSDISIESRLYIYPNPATSFLTIENTSTIQIESIKIYDTLGRLVLQEKEQYSSIDVSHLNSGLLFVKIETDQGIVAKKVLKE